VLSTLLELQIAERRWREALETLDEAVKRKAVDAEKGRRLKTAMMLGSSLAAEEAGNRDDALSLARKAHGQQRDFLPATIRVATLSAAAGARRAAIRTVEDAWPRTPHPALAALYGGLAGTTDPLKLVQRYEKLRGFNPDHPESHIALARAMLDARLWGGCRSHLEAAGGAVPPARVCRLMAELEEAENGDMAAVRRWLLRASEAAPDPAWICGDCGAVAAQWTPTCSRCGALGTLEWKAPERALATVDSPAPRAAPSGSDNGIEAAADPRSPVPPRGIAAAEGPPPVPDR
jgi:HemY protein